MPISLKPHEKNIIDSVLLQYPYRYSIFGSRATGKAKEASDLDLCIMDAITITEFAHIKEHFSTQPLPFSVDIVLWHRCSEEFKKGIFPTMIPYVPDLYLGAKITSLHHDLNAQIPTWDGSRGFELSPTSDHTTSLFQTQCITMNAGIGTHLDSPAHIFINNNDVAEFEHKHRYAWCTIWHNPKQVHESLIITKEDIIAFEQRVGPLIPRSWIIFMTGWGKYFENPHAYRNVSKDKFMVFPHIDSEAAEFLVARRIAGVGIDTLSPDPENSAFRVHKILLNAGIYIIENVRYDEQISHTGYLLINPLPMLSATESPVRLLFVHRPLPMG